MSGDGTGAAHGSRTGLTAACDGLIEACWLVAVAVVPLACHFHALFCFDPAKMALVRALGIVVAGALVVRIAGGQTSTAVGRPYWVVSGAFLLLAYAAASAFSVNPFTSVFGGQRYIQGAWTLACEISLFAGIAVVLRTGAQMERLVAAALAGGLPVALYALFQSAGLDPLNFSERGQGAFSFAGHPIFMAGYLLMLMPLCLWRLWRAREEAADGAERMSSGTTVYAALLCLILAAFVAAEKRGPFVALMVSCACALVLLAAYWRKFRMASRGVALLAVCAVFLAVLAGLLKGGAPIRDVPLLGRLAQVIPLGEDTGDFFRSSLWGAAPGIVTGTKSFVFPDGSTDRWHGLRAWFGYGPETLQGVLPQFWIYIWDGPAVIFESRFHNAFWDTWYSVGLVGLLASAWFFFANFQAGCRGIGLPVGGRRRGIFPAVIVGASACGALFAGLYGAGYFGLGFQLGFVAGLVLLLLWFASCCRPTDGRESPSHDMLVAGLLVSLLGFWTDTAFSFPMGNTTVLFWVFSGAVAGWSARSASLRESGEEYAYGHSVPEICKVQSRTSVPLVSPGKRQQPGRSFYLPERYALAPGLLSGALSGCMLVAMMHAFIGNFYGGLEQSATVDSVRYSRWAAMLIPLLLAPAWLGSVYLIGSAMPVAAASRRRLLLIAGTCSLGIGAAYGGWKAIWISAIGPVPAEGSPAILALRQAGGYESLGVVFLGVLLFGMAAAAAAIVLQAGRREFSPAGIRQRLVALAAIAACIPAIWLSSAKIFSKEACDRWALALDKRGRKALAADIYLRGLEMDPANGFNRIACANAWMELAERKDNRVPGLMERATALLVDGRRYSELNFGNYFLGWLYLRRALREPCKPARLPLALLAKEAFVRANTLAPQHEAGWVDASAVDRFLLGDARSADEKMRVADRLTAWRPDTAVNIEPAAWGDYYAAQSSSSAGSQLKAFYAHRALGYFDRALMQDRKTIRESPLTDKEFEKNQANQYQTLVAMGQLQAALGNPHAARELWKQAAETRSSLGTGEAEMLLAR